MLHNDVPFCPPPFHPALGKHYTFVAEKLEEKDFEEKSFIDLKIIC